MHVKLEIHACSNPRLTKNATIFWEHKVFVDCCHSNTVYFFQKTVKIMEKISVLILVLLTNFLFCHPYVTMPNVSLNLV